MCAQYFCCKADCLIRSQCCICVYVQRQLIVVGNLTYTGILNGEVDTLYRCVNCIDCDHTDRHIRCLTLVCADVSASLCDRKLHVELAVCTAIQMCNNLIRIHDLDILIHLNVSCGYGTFAFKLDVCDLCLIRLAVVFNRQRFDIHNNFCNVFFYARNRAELMKHTLDLNLAYSSTRQGRKHNSSQGISKGCAIASLEWFNYKSSKAFIF